MANPFDFKDHYGRLMTILNTDVEKGIFETLVQFYYSTYRCFTFPDYQLSPTLEDYSYQIRLLVLDHISFSVEHIPKAHVIGEVVPLRKRDIEAYLLTKGGVLGFPAKFPMEKVATLDSLGSMVAFEVVIDLLTYGLVLFPNIDNFVDINDIPVFLIQNLVPTILVDTYYSIHYKTEKNEENIVCCAPLLYKWFISYFPQSSLFKYNKNNLWWP